MELLSLQIKMLYLSQSKSYLKIIGVSYLIKNTNTPINSSVTETILKNNHIFYIIKISSKLNITIVWLDIWNVQSSSKAKGLINQYFIVGSYITTIKDANMNLDICCDNH